MHNHTQTRKKLPLAVISIVSVLAAMLILLLFNISTSQQSVPAIWLDVYFEGEYRIDDADWQPVKVGQHIPSTQGDVIMKGQFHMVAPDGEYLGPAPEGTTLAFYTNHIQITVQEEGQQAYTMDTENAYAGEGLCGEYCDGYTLLTAEPITLTFHNPHRFGNEKAIDAFLEEISIYGGLPYENQFLAQGNIERNIGLAFVIAAFVLLGTALFSALLHIDGSNRLWLVGLCILFAGGYFSYNAKGVFFWSNSIIANTTILGICIMMYMLCICTLLVTFLCPQVKKLGTWAVTFSGIVCVVITIICLATDIRFYDTWLWWAVAQTIVCIILLICLLVDSQGATKRHMIRNTGAAVLLIGFEADFLGIALGWWSSALVCQCIFIVLFIFAAILIWQIVPRNINAARKAEEMEAEQKVIRAQLQENRIAIMISQIQPHFIYNTLGTIQQLCKENPEQASQLVHRFSLYLRGNFSELDNTMPIQFAQELKHVHCYTEIELVRFPDMAVHYDIQTEEFLLPALTVQPLVENAIKHGLMGLEEGGNVTIATYETSTHYCVEVTDDGVGFDPNAPLEGKKHIGIRNVRERLQVMCGGTLTLESQPGHGTKALIQIPKEGKEL